MQLDVRENFFKGEEISDGEAIRLFQKERENYATFNIVGVHSVKIALGAGIISKGNVGEVDGVPFALLF